MDHGKGCHNPGQVHTVHAVHATASAVFTINAITVTRYDCYRNREVNIEIVRRRCEVGAAMATVVAAVLNSLGTGVFFPAGSS